MGPLAEVLPSDMASPGTPCNSSDVTKQPGDWQVEVKAEGQHVTGSPFHVAVFDPEKVRVFGLEGGAVGQLLSFSVDTTKAGQGDLLVNVIHMGRDIPNDVLEESPGLSKVKFVPPGAGTYKIGVTYSARSVKGNDDATENPGNPGEGEGKSPTFFDLLRGAISTGAVARPRSDSMLSLRDRRGEYYTDSYLQLNSSRSQLNGSRAHLNTSRSELNSSRSQLNSSRSHLNTSRSELNSSRPKVNGSRSHVNTSRSELTMSRSQLNASRPQLDDGRRHVSSASPATRSEGRYKRTQEWKRSRSLGDELEDRPVRKVVDAVDESRGPVKKPQRKIDPRCSKTKKYTLII